MDYRERIEEGEYTGRKIKCGLFGLVLLPTAILLCNVIYAIYEVYYKAIKMDEWFLGIILVEIIMFIVLIWYGFKADEEYSKIKHRNRIEEIYRAEANKISDKSDVPSARNQANMEYNIEKIANNQRYLIDNVLAFFTFVPAMNIFTSNLAVMLVLVLLVGILYSVLYIASIVDKTNKIENVIRKAAQDEQFYK